PPPHHVLLRGNYANPGREVQPGVPAIFCRAGHSSGFDLSSTNNNARTSAPAGSTEGANRHATRPSRPRLAFAEWVTSTDNPVFARLAVNRVWQGHFGVGLVATTDNLGLTGAKPSHPELLDWLATEFVRSGYSLKSLHRLVAKSATYRQASPLREEA